MYKNIILPVDLADKASLELLFPSAINFVKAFNAKLHVLYIISDFGAKLFEDYLPCRWVNDQKLKSRKALDDVIDKYLPSDILPEIHVIYGNVYDKIIEYSERITADLVIISAVSRQPPMRNYMLGPNTSKIVRHSNISVLVVR